MLYETFNKESMTITLNNLITFINNIITKYNMGSADDKFSVRIYLLGF